MNEVITSYASLLAALAALITGGVARRQLKLLREQNQSGQQASSAAVVAADAARDAVTETARSRADAYAPRITVLAEAPQWPPMISTTAAAGAGVFSSSVLHGSEPLGREELIFPESAERSMWFVVHSVLINEGASTARVRIMGDGQFIEGESPLLPGQVLTVPPLSSAARREDYLYQMHILRPGQSALIRWAAPMSVAAWTANHDHGVPPEAGVTVESFDHAAHGVTDRIKLSIIARVLQPVPGRDGHWALTTIEPREADVVVWPTEREYRSEPDA
ncbi:hypothetical protein [Streptomyces sp. NBC_01124]|uniref:hypothetical protein n=1 Tax=Streptomyces sp. NBC_01124 TaxID=2903753 RepID=UPI003867895B|nr:hypothetical protein OG368_00015 [Streptomyces sp. NBC_01124]WSU05893.1 hypothetical protein OG368_36920 [Streptomyces sp. NBC_01124]